MDAIKIWPEIQMAKKTDQEKMSEYFQYYKAFKEITRYTDAEDYLLKCEKLLNSSEIEKKIKGDVYLELGWNAYKKNNYAKAIEEYEKRMEIKLEL